MSVKVSALCWKISLPIADKLVLLRLADYAGDDGGNIYPSVATVAHFCGVSPRAVQYILKKFIDAGLLVVVGNETGGRGRTRHYAIDLERACQLSGPEGGKSNGTGKRVQRAQAHFTLSSSEAPGERVQRVQNSAVKGEVDLHPTRHGTVSKQEDDDAGAAPPVHTRLPEVVQRVADMAGIEGDAALQRNSPIAAKWLADGADPDADIYPAVANAMNRTPQSRIRGFGYFTDEITTQHRVRLTPNEGKSNVQPIRHSGSVKRSPGGGYISRLALGLPG